MNGTYALILAIVLVCVGGVAQADVFNMGPGLVSLETVKVGDPGNAADTRYETPGYGSVGYTYHISKYEITAAQYCEFLNHKAKSDAYGLWIEKMVANAHGCRIERADFDGSYTYSVAPDFANRPVNFVSYWDAKRFANWLHNGQGDGDTETGAYDINGYNDFDGLEIVRKPGAKWFLVNEDEWYKAAYYKGGGTSAGYWDYATQNNTMPSNDVIDPDPGNNVNYDNFTTDYSIGDPYWRTLPGEFENSESAYGTYDQCGNVWELNETAIDTTLRGIRGGSYINSDWIDLHASTRDHMWEPTREWRTMGFRVGAFFPRPTCGLNNRAAQDTIISAAASEFDFKVWGKVTVVDADSFTLDDGSGAPVTVVCPGHSGIADNDHACATGEFSGEGAGRVLNAQAHNVAKLL